MEKIDITKIRGHWQKDEAWNDTYRPVAGGDDTIKSIQMVAEKMNEIVEWINKCEKWQKGVPHNPDLG